MCEELLHKMRPVWIKAGKLGGDCALGPDNLKCDWLRRVCKVHQYALGGFFCNLGSWRQGELQFHERSIRQEQLGIGLWQLKQRWRGECRSSRRPSEDALNERTEEGGLAGVIRSWPRLRVVEEEWPEWWLKAHRAFPHLPASPTPLPLVELRREAFHSGEANCFAFRLNFVSACHAGRYLS